MTRQIILPEFRDHPPMKVDIYRLSLARARNALKEIYPVSSGLGQFASQEILSRTIDSSPTLYDILRERADNYELNPNGYLGYLNQEEAYAVLEYKKKELTEILTHARLLHELHKGVEEKGYKVFNEFERKINDKLLREIRDDILALREPWRGEYLNARFSEKDGRFYLIRKKLNEENLYEKVEESLDEDTLLQYKEIDLVSWISNPTKQGLPKRDVKNGKINYWPPADGAVAGLSADADRFYLDCDRDPLYSDPGLGMRAQNFKYT